MSLDAQKRQNKLLQWESENGDCLDINSEFRRLVPAAF
jgi:hypothetical protein